jgi:hypothetical protein
MGTKKVKNPKNQKTTEFILKPPQFIWRWSAYIYNELIEAAAAATLVLLQ